MKYYLCLALTLPILSSVLQAQNMGGCTDPQATNYNSNALVNDGSCLYADNTITNFSSFLLSNQLKETSGLAYFNNQIYTHNDDTQKRLYVIDTIQGSLIDSVEIPYVVNVDWEDVHVENGYFYVGDFGNNVSGNRTNLRIFKWHSDNHNTGNFSVDTIKFSYQDQVSFSPVSANTTAFDCEAFIVIEDSIYLFTKRWNDQKSYLYVLPNDTGTHVAQLRDSLNVGGLITGATYDAQRKHVVLCGYSILLQPFVYMLYDYPQNDFFKGNKRKINFDLSMHQMEAVTHDGNMNYYFSNEYTQVSIFPEQQAKLHKYSLARYFTNPVNNDPNTGMQEVLGSNITIYPNPSTDKVYFTNEVEGYRLLDMHGKVLISKSEKSTCIDLSKLPKGVYFVEVKGIKNSYRLIKN